VNGGRHLLEKRGGENVKLRDKKKSRLAEQVSKHLIYPAGRVPYAEKKSLKRGRKKKAVNIS